MLKLQNWKKKNKQANKQTSKQTSKQPMKSLMISGGCSDKHSFKWVIKRHRYQIRTITAASRNYEIFNKDVYDMKEKRWSLPCVKQYFKLKRWKIDIMKSSERLKVMRSRNFSLNFPQIWYKDSFRVLDMNFSKKSRGHWVRLVTTVTRISWFI